MRIRLRLIKFVRRFMMLRRGRYKHTSSRRRLMVAVCNGTGLTRVVDSGSFD